MTILWSDARSNRAAISFNEPAMPPPRDDLKFSGLHGACRGQNKNRSEPDIGQPFAHHSLLPRGALHRDLDKVHTGARLSELLGVSARDTHAHDAINNNPTDV